MVLTQYDYYLYKKRFGHRHRILCAETQKEKMAVRWLDGGGHWSYIVIS